MLTTKNLEKLIELENTLREEYQAQLDAKSAEIEQHIKEKDEKQAVIATQLQTITSLTSGSADTKRIEQLNRELERRSENLQEEVTSQKKRLKSLQADLAEARAEIKALKQFDPAKMKKNLEATKKKMAEKATATDLLQKSLNKSKTSNVELQQQVKQLEARLEELEAAEDGAEKEEAAA